MQACLRSGAIVLAGLLSGGCSLMGFFDESPDSGCAEGTERSFENTCGACLAGTRVERCNAEGEWLEDRCENLTIDADGDGYVNEHCAERPGGCCPEALVDCNDGDETIHPDTWDCLVADGARSCVLSCGADGAQACGDDCTWGDCLPSNNEICNGIDDDCDTTTDNGYACAAGATQDCTTTCGTTGTRNCTGACAWESDCRFPAEECNGLDDDCDRTADDGFPCAQASYVECTAVCGTTGHGTCTAECAIPAAADCSPPLEQCANSVDDDCDTSTDELDPGQCTPGASVNCTTTCGSTGTGTCTAGCIPPTGAACATPVEICDAADDDCDGATDEDFACTRRIATSCTTTCGTTGSGTCTDECAIPAPADCAPPAEACNTIDDDCDGATDEDFACIPGAVVGCTATCGSTGTGLCTASCNPAAPADCTPPTEICNGADDDCDTSVDDGFPCIRGASRSCTVCGAADGTQTCDSSCLGWSACTRTEDCNGCDDDGDTTADEDFACVRGASLSCTTACGTPGTNTCTSSCAVPAASTCAAATETCNACDDDGDTTVDDGFLCTQGVTEPCTVCGRSSTHTCAADCGSWSACTLSEACNNCDDDGDGATDETFTCPQGTTGHACTQDGCTGLRACSGTCGWLACVPDQAPLPVRPRNGAQTGSYHARATFPAILRPTFSWQNPCGSGTVTYDLQITSLCTSPIGCDFTGAERNLTGLTTTSYTPPADLAVSTAPPFGRRYDWRVRVCTSLGDCGPWSATRYVNVGRVRNDFNGDGYSDLAVGAAYFDDTGSADEGRVWIYYGSATGIPTAPSVTVDCPGGASCVGGLFGGSLAAGDLDADGYADLAVGAQYYRSGATPVGSVFLFQGESLAAPAPRQLPSPTLESNAAFGAAVAVGWDLDADGYADLAVGMPSSDTPVGGAGRVYVYRGAATLAVATPVATLDSPAFTAGGAFGSSVAWVPGPPGPGFAGLLVGAPYEDHPESSEGGIYFFTGGPAGLATTATVVDHPADRIGGLFGSGIAWAGDLDGDGNEDVMAGAPGGISDFAHRFAVLPTGMAAVPVASLPCPGSCMGAFFGGAFGRVERADGTFGLVVAARGYANPTPNEGNAFYFDGSATTPATSFDNPTGIASTTFGWGTASCGDLNGDGLGDIAIGARNQNATYNVEGAAYVYYATSTGFPATPSVSLANPTPQLNGRFGEALQ